MVEFIDHNPKSPNISLGSIKIAVDAFRRHVKWRSNVKIFKNTTKY